MSKRLPEAAQNYSITELETCGLAINITSFAHLLIKVDFDVIVNHLALTHIIKNKVEPVTTRIKRLLEVLSSYSFNLYYMKGKVMILSDFLSKQKIDESNPHEIIPISFNMRNVLHDRYYNIRKTRIEDKYLVQTRSQSVSNSINLPEVHGVDKGINPHVRPKKQTSKPITVTPETNIPDWKKPRLGQGRAGIRGKVKVIKTLQINKSVPVISKSERQKLKLPHSPRLQ